MVKYEWVSVYISFKQPLIFGTSPSMVFLTQQEYDNMKPYDKICGFSKGEFIPKEKWSKNHFQELANLLK